MKTFSLASCRWRFRDAQKKGWHPAVVPGCVHMDLRRAGLIPDPFWGTNELQLQWIEERDWEYRTEFSVPGDLLAQEVVELVSDGLDTVATVTLNGKVVGRTENMFQSHRWEIGRLLKPRGNVLVVRFDSAMRYVREHHTDLEQGEINDPLGRAPAIRKQQCQFGWDWGPRLVTAGIWRDLRLEAWSVNRLQDVRVTQRHEKNGSVTIECVVELARPERGAVLRGRIFLESSSDETPFLRGCAGNSADSPQQHASPQSPEASATAPITPVTNHPTGLLAGVAVLRKPKLWWPAGQGAQPLYTVEVVVERANGAEIGRWQKRIGLRTIALDRHADRAGESFQFVVNGRAIFAKGANWIPAHAFVAALTRNNYERDLRAAVEANMNMIRVWGGGIYESEHFYDLCDELGLLVWQDFMFACALYPGEAKFVASVRTEAQQQVRRLRHRACLALWCGNNEIEQLNGARLQKPAIREAYTTVFERVLPEVVAALDGVTAYWPSSQHRSDGDNTHAGGERTGDTHFWDVWHARHPVKAYEKWKFRFCSEFGMQSFSSPETNATFCPPDDDNVFGAAMENHQKNRGGNQVILDYVSRRYRFPKSQDDLIYLSQLNQAHCMQVGVEHYRRLIPHCMGALYWQLNDCWPVASWSSIEFTGRWRALHHVARRFFAPALVTAHVPGDEIAGVGNYRQSDVREVHLYTVYDAPQAARGTLRWNVFHLDGRILQHGEKTVALKPGASVRQRVLDLSSAISQHGRDSLYVRIALETGNRRVSEETVFLSPPRFLSLPRADTAVRITLRGALLAEITFESNAFQHRFAFELTGVPCRCSDNYFELYPGEPKVVMVQLEKPATLAHLKRALSYRSLVDTYPHHE